MSKTDIITLGLNLYHGATACLLKNGEILGCVSEERFSRKKNEMGIPEKAIKHLLSQNNISAEDIDLVGLGGSWPTALLVASNVKRGKSLTATLINLSGEVLYRFPALNGLYNFLHQNLYQRFTFPGLKKNLEQELQNRLGVKNIEGFDHHQCHAAVVSYGFVKERQDKEWLVFTNDAAGDGFCTSINQLGKSGLKQLFGQTKNSDSPAWIYSIVTQYMGMRIIEHEYKIMGLAPYADKKGVERVYPVFRELFSLDDDLAFHSKINVHSFYRYLHKNLERHRFDGIAGAVQQLVEELLIDWVRQGIKKTGITNVALGGGIFLNVKANMLLSEIAELDNLVVCPTGGDESNAIGAAYLAYEKICKERKVDFSPKRIETIYLGNEYNDEAIKKSAEQYKFKSNVEIKKYDNIEEKVAQLLSEGEVVARFNGRMEWGARSLGNRSILANPANQRVVRKINELIKCRDFWMPFAGTIIYERAKDYLLPSKNLDPFFMATAFRTTDLAKKDLPAMLHPYDETTRPQVLKQEHNPSYYKIIKEFEKLTGIGACLNTSFNIHGEPIVCTPEDAFHTLDDSGLEYLAIGSFLISKK